MQRLVSGWQPHADKIVKLARQRRPLGVDDAQDGVAVLDAFHDHADAELVIDSV
jgi:hypothetical protein